MFLRCTSHGNQHDQIHVLKNKFCNASLMYHKFKCEYYIIFCDRCNNCCVIPLSGKCNVSIVQIMWYNMESVQFVNIPVF